MTFHFTYLRSLLHRLQRLGIRQQLTLVYTVIFIVLILGCGLLAYKYLEYTLAMSVDATLALREDQFADEVKLQDHKIVVHDVLKELQSIHADENNAQVITADIQGNSMVRILDSQGHSIYASPAFQVLDLPANSFTQALHGQPWTDTVRTHKGDQEIRMYSEAVSDQGTTFAVVQVGESLSPLHTILRQLFVILLIIALILVPFASLGSLWLSGLAFAPIYRLILAARKIQESNLSQRVPVPAAHDEVYELAITLNDMIERLEKAFARQRRFVADASHELRTPVAAIRSKTDIALLESHTQTEYHAILQQINSESEHLGVLISDLLALARADEGQAHLEHESVQLDFLIAEVVANAEVMAQERHITLTIKHSEPVTVLGDETRLIQVVMNLLDNALIYTNAGGTVSVSLQRDTNGALIQVSDTGEGIAAQHLPHIFERFYRADPARIRHAGSSSGLGLSIVEWVVRAHGGKISVQSQLGRGSTFSIILPNVIQDATISLS